VTTAPVRSISTLTLVLLIGAIALTDIITTRLEPPGTDAPIKIGIVLAFVLWGRFGARLSWDELGLARAKVGAGFRIGCLAALVIGAAIVVLVAIPATRGYFQSKDVAADSTASHWLEPLVFIPLGTVVFEETIFRGVLLGVLLRMYSQRRAVVVSALVFGLWHIPPALTDASGKSAIAALGVVLGTIAVTAAAGIGFAILRVWSGSLIAPVFAHIATNSLAYVGALVALHL
jgi:membrane protease YdiL (CAAX protease family)